MRAAILGIGEKHLDGAGPFLLLRLLCVGQHQADIIGVAERQIAFAGPDRLGLAAVVAVGLAHEIVLQARQPFLGRFRTIMGDHGGE